MRGISSGSTTAPLATTMTTNLINNFPNNAINNQNNATSYDWESNYLF